MISQDSISLRVLNIDSRLRKSGTSGDFWFELVESVEKPRGCVGWVTEVSMPTTLSNINENCNKFYIREERSDLHKEHVLTLPSFQYQTSGLREKLQLALDERRSSVLERLSWYEVLYADEQLSIELRHGMVKAGASHTRYDYRGFWN